MEREKLLLTTHLSAGDIITMTAAVRDIHRAHPGRYAVNVQTSVMEVWENNPYLDRSVTRANADRVIEMHYTDAINRCNSDKSAHFITGYVGHLAKELGVEIPLTELKPDIHFSSKELATPVLPDLEGRQPYWVMFAGGKTDYTAKWWHKKKFEKVVSMLPDIKFVQVGATGNDKWNPPIPGAVQMIGKTTFRSLLRLILGSHGVLCPVTCGLHIAAALDKPCVILSGGREGWWWEQYENQVYLHTIGGNLDCCRGWSCWRSHVDLKYVGRTNDQGKSMSPEERNSKVCLRVVDRDGQKQPLCMDAISPERVVAEITRYQKEEPYMRPDEYPDFVRYETGKAVTEGVLGGGRAAVCVCLYGNDGDDVIPKVCNKIGDEFESIPTLTYAMLHSRCINSILNNTDLSLINLYVGCNDVSDQTLGWLQNTVGPELEKHGGRLVLVNEPSNIHKYPMMRELYSRLHDEQWVIWFDDDSYATSDQWLHRVLGAAAANPDTKTFGEVYCIQSVRGQWDWVTKAEWFKGKKPYALKQRVGRKYPVYRFLAGGFQVISRDVIENLGWPDKRINHNGGDVMFGEACRQNDIKMKDLFNEGNVGIVISGANRRGYSETPAGVHDNLRKEHQHG